MIVRDFEQKLYIVYSAYLEEPDMLYAEVFYDAPHGYAGRWRRVGWMRGTNVKVYITATSRHVNYHALGKHLESVHARLLASVTLHEGMEYVQAI